MPKTKEDLCIAGVDEAGRGPLAGPVVAGAVILNPRKLIEGLTDSKLLNHLQREKLYDLIVKNSLAWAVGQASVEEIDEINILQATLLAMRRAVLALSIVPSQVRVDGNICPDIPMKVSAHIGGDRCIPAISAASIVAKVTRDRQMMQYDKIYPHYGFAAHKGYGTPAHLLHLRQLGATPIHRTSFAPVRQVLLQGALRRVELENET